jgi:ligand-binding sensor domain-containing protein/signal transduction histidine kinase
MCAMHVALAVTGAAAAGNTSQPASGSLLPEYVRHVWRTQDGLPENRIRAISQTPDGYLWIGTSGGLARFDGVRFVIYARFNTPAMTDDNIRALSVAKDGSLWVATDGGGLLHFRDGHFRAFGPNDGLTNEFISSVLEDREGKVWVATRRGLFRLDGARFERVDKELQLSNIAFFGVYEGRDGRVLAGGPAGLFSMETGKLSPARQNRELEQVYQIREARDRSLWLSTNHGLQVIGRDRSLHWPHATSLIGAIQEDHSGAMWIGTLGNGLFLVPSGQDVAVQVPTALPDNSVAAILEDREQNIWVGTADGLVRLSAPEVGLLNSRQGLPDDNVSTVYCDPHGSVWLTTVTGEVFRYTGGRLRPVHLPPPADRLRIRGSFEDHTGALWFGTDNQGAVRLAKGVVSRFTVADGLRNNGMQGFFEDSERNLWMGTTSGLSRWDGSHFTNYYLEQGLSYGWIRAFAQDHNGDMLVGTDRGINRFHDGKIVPDPAFAQLSPDRIWSILPESPDTLWIATRGAGLVRVRRGQTTRITVRQGLVSNSIFQIIGDRAGRLWMSGPLGLSSASLADLNSAADGKSASIAVLSYGTADGLESSQMNGGIQPSGCLAADGELWFPSVKGAVHFKPDSPRVSYDSPVRLETVRIDDKTVASNAEVRMGPGRQRVEIEFTVCSFRAPGRVKFQYKLGGFDPQWTVATGRRAAVYDNLPPGRYEFRVTARDGSVAGASSEAGVVLVVQPHFYQTFWFYALAVAFAGVCAAGVFLLQERQARDRYNLRLAERTRIAREMHDTVVQGCVGVSTLIEAAVGSARSDQELMLECLDSARLHLRLTLDEARQALTDLRHDSFENGLPGALLDLVQAVSREKGVQVTLEETGAMVPLADFTNRALLLVTREAIRNAVVHGAPAAVCVRLSYGSSAVRLEIQDNGCGLDATPARLTAEGHFGILGMRERIEQIGGSLEIVSNPGSGTTITAHLPLGRIPAGPPAV